VRQDLIKLEELQIAIRVHGGAVLKKTEKGIYPIGSRKLKHAEEKSELPGGPSA
jgi:DeoR/GlpR family transcriptional regulator of sugar metabolism